MKISQVLIDSQQTRKQIRGCLIHIDTDYNIDGYCALGALACAKGKEAELKRDTITFSHIIKLYGVDPTTNVTYPASGAGILDFVNAIWMLNDRKDEWTFERIGNWIKDLEDEGIIKYD